MNIRYIFKDKINQVVYEKIHSLEEIEKNGVGGPFTEILSRDIGTGKVDRTGKEGFEHDRIKNYGGEIGVIDFRNGEFVVDYNESRADYAVDWDSLSAIEFEIIGRAEE